jgi:hypothetical protein
VSPIRWGQIRQNRRWLIRLALVAVAGLGLAVWYTHQRSQSRLTVENRSGQRIGVLEVTAAGEKETFRDVAVGAAVASSSPVQRGERFEVKGRLADGTRIKISGLIGERLELVVLPGGIVQFRPSRG